MSESSLYTVAKTGFVIGIQAFLKYAQTAKAQGDLMAKKIGEDWAYKLKPIPFECNQSVQ